MADIATLAIELEARSAKFDAQLKKSQKQIGRLEKQTKKTSSGFVAMTRAARGFMGVLAGGALLRFSREQARAARTTLITADRLGVQAEQYQELEAAALEAGVATERFEDSFVELIQRFGEARRDGGEAAEGFREIGLAFEDMEGRGSVDLLLEVQARLREIRDPALRAATAAKIFGDEGARTSARMVDLSNETLAAARESQRFSSVIDSEVLESMAAMDKLLETTSVKLVTFGTTAIATAVDGLARLHRAAATAFADTDIVADMDELLAEMGLGENVVRDFYQAWADGANQLTLEYAALAAEQERAAKGRQDLERGFAGSTVTDPNTYDRLSDAIKDANEIAYQSTVSTTQAMGDAFTQFAMSAELDVKRLARSISANLLSMLTQNLLLQGIFKVGSGLFPGVPLFTNAKGGVVNAPVAFPQNGGIGVAGEAGPEAILPLKRDASGNLGVVSQGGGSSVFAPTVNVTVENPQGGADEGRAFGREAGAQIDRELRKSFGAYLKDQSRPGGLLSPVS